MADGYGAMSASALGQFGPSDWEPYIRAAATQRGIDPDVAVRVAKSEGLGGSYTGDQGSSFGPFQLHYGGVARGGNAVSGLGDEFTRQTGLHASDPMTVPAQIDFALDHASRNGWGAWHGWKGDAFAGISGGAGAAPMTTAAISAPMAGAVPAAAPTSSMTPNQGGLQNALANLPAGGMLSPNEPQLQPADIMPAPTPGRALALARIDPRAQLRQRLLQAIAAPPMPGIQQ